MIKIERSYPAPESLAKEAEKANGSYSCPDVTARLQKDFHDKCYICELKELQDPEVEHLLPHKNGKYRERKFDWENLFWACAHCNRIKNQKKYEGGILDCCKRDPEEAILFEMMEKDVHVAARNLNDTEAMLTAQLVTEVFNLKNTGMRIHGSELRLDKLREEMNVLYTKLAEHKKKPESKLIKRTLRALLSRESAFAGFKRCYVRERLAEFPELEQYIA